MVTVYGIPNCDTIKKTLDWMKKHKIEYEFHDYKKESIDKPKLLEWCNKVNWEILLNKKSATWRSLPLSTQQKISTQNAAIRIMMENTSIIKRPVIENGDKIIVGFSEDDYKLQLL
jgi:arsenate reductase (glutaredoxin)